MRATMSPAFPAETVLMAWIDRLGQLAATAAEDVAKRTTPAMAPHNARNDVIGTSLAMRAEIPIDFVATPLERSSAALLSKVAYGGTARYVPLRGPTFRGTVDHFPATWDPCSLPKGRRAQPNQSP